MINTLNVPPRQPARANVAKQSPSRVNPQESVNKSKNIPAAKVENLVKPALLRLGASYPAVKTSKIDPDARPLYEPNGKPITEIDMDAGSDLTFLVDIEGLLLTRPDRRFS